MLKLGKLLVNKINTIIKLEEFLSTPGLFFNENLTFNFKISL